jgi:hypothetical protein
MRGAGGAVAGAFLLVACQEVGQSSIDIPTPQERGVSFSAGVQPILTERCAFSGCHGAPEAVPGANFEAGKAYGNLVNVPSVESTLLAPSPDLILDRVEPFNPAKSYLYLKITGCDPALGCFGDRMPRSPAGLNDADLSTIRQWIEQGAQEN